MRSVLPLLFSLAAVSLLAPAASAHVLAPTNPTPLILYLVDCAKDKVLPEPHHDPVLESGREAGITCDRTPVGCAVVDLPWRRCE